jgi:hypothetical protein
MMFELVGAIDGDRQPLGRLPAAGLVGPHEVEGPAHQGADRNWAAHTASSGESKGSGVPS